MALLSVRNLSIQYELPDGRIYAADDVSFDIEERSIIGLLGESGSGKSTVAQALVRILPPNARIQSGEIRFKGEDILEMSDERLREIRWADIAYIPQSAMGSLDPIYTLREQLVETVVNHEPSMTTEEANARAEEVLDIVGINAVRLDDYPHELSGGMRQRVLLAMSLLLEPDFIIADEPTTGLDVLLRDKILNDIERYRDEFGISILFISHDIADLVETCNDLLVMYGGKMIEKGGSRDLFADPTHPYTIGLKHSLPTIHGDPSELISMDMDPPDNRSEPDKCVFIDKCPFAVEECTESHPPFSRPRDGVESACYRNEEARDLTSRVQEVSW